MFFPLNLCHWSQFWCQNFVRTKLSTLKTLIFANCWGPEVVWSSSRHIRKMFSQRPIIKSEYSWVCTKINSLYIPYPWTRAELVNFLHSFFGRNEGKKKIVWDFLTFNPWTPVESANCSKISLSPIFVKIFKSTKEDWYCYKTKVSLHGVRSFLYFVHGPKKHTYFMQGQLQEWTEHSHWFFENLKPVEISKNNF